MTLSPRSLARAVRARLPPKLVVHLDFLRFQGYWPNVRHPVTFSEKVQHRKLYDADARFVAFSDKIEVKAHVAGMLGEAWVIPTLWHGTELPGAPPTPLPLIVKASFGSGMNHFVRTVDEWDRARAVAAGWMAAGSPAYMNEAWYNRMPRRLLVEPVLPGEMLDYKFYTFGSHVELVQVDTSRFTGHHQQFYDPDWNELDFKLDLPIESRKVGPPRHLARMLAAAAALGREFEFVRVDFYDTDEGPRFGEMTFSPGSGYDRIEPRRHDYRLGELWRSVPAEA